MILATNSFTALHDADCQENVRMVIDGNRYAYNKVASISRGLFICI